MTNLDGMYYDFHLPLGLHNLLEEVVGRSQSSPNSPKLVHPTANRAWFSQPRPGNDPTTEVITVNFKEPVLLSEINWEVLRVSCHVELWYYDRQNNWRAVLDETRVPVAVNVVRGKAPAWYKAHSYCYPFVAKKLQWRFTRVFDALVGNVPYCVGMRHGLPRRNIYKRYHGIHVIEPQQDPVGNIITSYIKDWDPIKAIDNNPTTFWRSMPMPDPEAVVSLYLDCRDSGGSAQLVDGINLDPVYVGQDLNVYYSNDDTEGPRRISPIGLIAHVTTNTTWQHGKGRWHVAELTCDYEVRFTYGPLISQDAWIGIEWAPDFDPTDGPAADPVLFQVTPTGTPDATQYWPKVYYDVSAAAIVCEFTNGTDTWTYSAPLSPLPVQYDALRIVVGWSYDPDTVAISVVSSDGTVLADFTDDPTTLPALISFDGTISFANFRGLFTAHIVKLEHFNNGRGPFQHNPHVYVSPDPITPDDEGNIPSTTLDNAIYAVAWGIQEHGIGGGDESKYQSKAWTPIWRDYATQKGRLIFPQAIRLKYLKLEFSNLTEEPYPVYDFSVKTTYKVYPLHVKQNHGLHLGQLGLAPGQLKKNGGLLSLGADVLLTGIGSVNWLNPATVNNATNAIFGQVIQPVNVLHNVAANITTLPNTSSLDVDAITRQEVSSPWVYKRSPANSSALAGHMLKTTGSTNFIQGLATNATALLGDVIAGAFSPLIPFSQNPPTLPVQGTDWWVFPGATLRLPALIMNGLFGNTQVVLARKPNGKLRLRFAAAAIHRYDVKTITRDAAVGYFAGVREVQPLVSTYISELDPDVFAFSSYDASQWVHNNVRALDSGPITTAGPLYEIENAAFDQGIELWTQVSGSWSHEPSTAHGHWHPGSAHVVADGTYHQLNSTIIDVAPGAHLDASVWVSWQDFVAADDSEALQFLAEFYNDDTLVDTQSVTLSYPTWPDETPEEAGNNWTRLSANLVDENQFLVPEGVNTLHLALVVTEDATAGDVYFDTVEIATTDQVEATIFKDFLTTSTFSKLTCKFSDSGLVRSDSMWAREDPLAVNIGFTDLAYYVSTIPDVMPAGMWSDTFAGWGDDTITWGAPRALVAINVDPDRIYQGKRVLHFTRAGGAEEAGVKIRQITNFAANGLFRIGCTFYKPNVNDNQVTVRLRRVSDGVYIYEETFTPVVGYWYEYITPFVEIPDSEDQVYTVELVCTGDDPDEFYLNDLYCDCADIRYFVRLGGTEEFLHDVTALVYTDPPAIVSTTEPVNEFSVQAAILSPRAWAYSGSFTPTYLK